MFAERIRLFFTRDNMPNKLSVAMGKLIKHAREEKGMSQAELAEKIYKRRPSMSEIENGKMYPDVQDLILLSYYLDKPLVYFIPDFAYRKTELSNLTEDETELLIQFRKIHNAGQRRIAIGQLRVLVETDIREDENDEDEKDDEEAW